ncbi:MAG: MarR family transcriptional regulator [Actinomycetaceae bacterium]|nr:MarR family transcriptional regulator [Actinomycetaceae bacterium]
MSEQYDQPTIELFGLWRTTMDATNLIQARLEELLKSNGGLSLGDYSVLLTLAQTPHGYMKLGELARQTSFSAARVTYMMHSLERRGFVERKASEQDGRIVFAHMTPRGRRVFNSCHAAYCEHIEQWCLSCVSPDEADVLHRVFSRIAQRLRDN